MQQRPPLFADLRKALARFLRRKGLRGPVAQPAPGSAAPSGPPRTRTVTRTVETEVKAYAVPLDREAWPTRAVLRLSSPRFGDPAVNAVFSEHPLDRDGAASERVIALHDRTAFESRDLGETWTPSALDSAWPVEQSFTTSTGAHIVATQPMAAEGDAETHAVIRRFDAAWQPAGEPLRTRSAWHGSCSIGEKDGVILFAEYPINRGKYGSAEHLPLTDRLVSDPCVYRSRDDGRTWEKVFCAPATQVRHLHTVTPDPHRPHRWWLTSGDRAEEVFVWISDDDGDTWTDITSDRVDGPLHRNCRPRAAQRLTDQVFHDGWVIWGADDWLGDVRDVGNGEHPGVGSRIFKARVDGPWLPQEIGYAGPPLRSIVDVGPAFLFISEAKARSVTLRPESFLVFKDDLSRVHRFVQFDNWGENSTGFTYSRASRKARDGVFFSYRGARDVFARSPRFLRWEIEFL